LIDSFSQSFIQSVIDSFIRSVVSLEGTKKLHSRQDLTNDELTTGIGIGVGLLELPEARLDLGHGVAALGRVLRKEVLLAARPDLEHDLSVVVRSDDNADRILVDAVLDHVGVGKDPPEGRQGRVVFLLPAVSVSRIGDGKFCGCAHGDDAVRYGRSESLLVCTRE